MAHTASWYEWWEKWSNFFPRQREFEYAVDNYDYVLYGGSAGPGKSYALRKYPVKFLIEKCWHDLGLKGVRVGLFCEDYPALQDRHLSRLPYEFPKWLGEYKAQQHEFILAPKYGGGVIAFRNLDDPSKYLSSEFALIAVDELTRNTKEKFDFLRMRKRWPGIPRTKFIAATNPGDIGHLWVKSLFVDRVFDVNEKESEQFKLIQALPTDNPYLPETYYNTLRSLPENLRKAYMEGNWDIFAGQYFTEWDRSRHTCPPFAIPKHWKLFRAYDHGREAPACCLWFALDPEGRVWVYREFYARGMNVDEIAEKIDKLSGDEMYEYSVADPAIFANTGFVDRFGGQTIAEAFARRGIMFMPASNRRIDGWNLVHQYLAWSPEKAPKVIFFTTCENSIRTIPALVHDDHRVEDLDTKGEDHAADVVRYFLASLHERVAPPPLNDTQRKLEELKRQEQLLDFDFYAPKQ